MTKAVRGSSNLILNNKEILSVPVFGRGTPRVLKTMVEWLREKDQKRTRMVVTVNPEHVMKAWKDGGYMNILRSTDMNVLDGIGLAWAREVLSIKYQVLSIRILMRLWRGFWVGVGILRGGYREDLVPGVELMDRMCGLGYRVGFLGGWGDRAEKTKEYFEKKYKGFEGTTMGEEYDGQITRIMETIKKDKVKILLVAYGMERQERWIEANLTALGQAGVKVAMGVGRSFDYYSGDLKRAPGWVRRIGFEWLYSLLKEPKRWRRQLVLPEFIWKVLTQE